MQVGVGAVVSLALSGSVFFQPRLSLLSESFSVPSTDVSHWLDHYVLSMY